MACHPLISVLVDLGILILGFIGFALVKTKLPIFHRGFFCDDESLMHPYHSNTVPFWVVLLVGFSANFLAMLLFIPVKLRREGGYRYFSKDTLIAIFRFTWPSVVLLLSGFIITSVLTDLPKAVIGRLRPHFFDVCQPVYSGNCTPTRGYITDYKCRGKGFPENTIYDMRKSFPSGHSSAAIFFAVALMLYLQTNIRKRQLVVLRSFIQAIAFTAAVYVCVSRISDYKHHWSDVLAGGVLGIFVPVVVKSLLGEFDPELSGRHSEVVINESPNPL